jgi:hypothetical protein
VGVKALDKSLAQAQQRRWLVKNESFLNFELALNFLPSHGLNLRGGDPHILFIYFEPLHGDYIEIILKF